MFSSISGAGGSAPLQRTQPKAPRRDHVIEPEQPAEGPRKPASLIHPGTAHEFRQRLEPLLRQLPPALIRTFVDQGYQLHVIDTAGLHPLTLEVSDYDLRRLDGDEPECILAPLHDGGATTQEDLDEWLHYVQLLNPELDASASAQQEIYLPAYGYWFGRRLPVNTIAFLRDPRALLEPGMAPSEPGTIAGMVTHGLLPGLHDESNRILFWDFCFRKNDPLLDWYVLHELGHTTDYSLAFRHPDGWREWLGRLEECFSQNRPWLTSYSATSPHEYFAEGFAAWATQSRPRSAAMPASALAAQRLACDRAQLAATDPWLHELIEEAVGYLLG
ncbi:MAG: hypothetical protein KF760_05330 [Candidatus Eremiobacteraeota bacterium]|nr:hypothetical protein [Candidatus Eremiobacteraeota bacterium]MCW5867168.1 hypothetical protein [Candidatus Eremiobacteraeota bacterium]